MQYLKKCPEYVKNLFKHKNLDYISTWDIFISNF